MGRILPLMQQPTLGLSHNCHVRTVVLAAGVYDLQEPASAERLHLGGEEGGARWTCRWVDDGQDPL
jgi:hypothetical protein